MGLPQRTPEQFLDAFEYFNREYSLDPQFTVGLPIIREWIGLRSKPTVSQADFDTLLDRFAAARAADDYGSQLHDLWIHVRHWGTQLGLSA